MFDNVFVTLQDYVLMTHEVTCVEKFLPHNTLYTGCANGNIIVWDIERSLVDKM